MEKGFRFYGDTASLHKDVGGRGHVQLCQERDYLV